MVILSCGFFLYLFVKFRSRISYVIISLADSRWGGKKNEKKLENTAAR